MSAKSAAAAGRPTDDHIVTALRETADFWDARHDTAEASYFRSLANRLGTEHAPHDETLYRALRDGGALFSSYSEKEKGTRLKALAAQLVEANPKAMPSTKPSWKAHVTEIAEDELVEAL